MVQETIGKIQEEINSLIRLKNKDMTSDYLMEMIKLEIF
jgi:hypothetical protein